MLINGIIIPEKGAITALQFEYPLVISDAEYVTIRDGAGRYFRFPSLTTVQKTALSAKNGMVVYDSDLGQLEAYQNGSWGVIGGSTTLGELSDVTVTSVADNEVLAYDSATSEWINQTPSEAGILAADGSVPLTAPWDAGPYDIRAATITPDGLTSGRVVFAGTNGLLSDDAGLTFGSNLLTVTKTAIGATQGDYGLALVNTTAAAAGAQQYSPPVRWLGYGWKTDATAASQSVDFRAFVRPIEGTAAPTGALDFQASINGGAYSDLLTVLSNGNVGINTTGPGALLHIIKGQDSASYIKIENPNTSGNSGLYAKADWGGVVYQAIGSTETVTDWAGYGRMRSDSGALGIVFATGGADPLIFAPQDTERMRILSNGNIGIGTVDQFGSGVKVIGIANATTVPTVTPTGGGVLYATAGSLHWLGSGGTDTAIAPA